MQGPVPVAWTFLVAVLLALAAVLVADRQVSRRRARRLRRLAERSGYRYSLVDRFRLAGRLPPALPADGLTVRDLMYRREGDAHVYAFTALTAGPPRRRVVVRATEPAGAGGGTLTDVRFADDALPLGEQYRRLLHETAGPPAVSDVRPSPGESR